MLRVAIQMDPIHTININADSTFALGLEAQARGGVALALGIDIGSLLIDIAQADLDIGALGHAAGHRHHFTEAVGARHLVARLQHLGLHKDRAAEFPSQGGRGQQGRDRFRAPFRTRISALGSIRPPPLGCNATKSKPGLPCGACGQAVTDRAYGFLPLFGRRGW